MLKNKLVKLKEKKENIEISNDNDHTGINHSIVDGSNTPSTLSNIVKKWAEHPDTKDKQ